MKIIRGQLKVAVPESKFYSAPLHDKRFFGDSFGIYLRLELEMGLLMKNVIDNYEFLEYVERMSCYFSYFSFTFFFG